MNFEEYQKLSPEDKMIARIRSLDNVARSSNFDLALDQMSLLKFMREQSDNELSNIKASLTRLTNKLKKFPFKYMGQEYDQNRELAKGKFINSNNRNPISGRFKKVSKNGKIRSQNKKKAS